MIRQCKNNFLCYMTRFQLLWEVLSFLTLKWLWFDCHTKKRRNQAKTIYHRKKRQTIRNERSNYWTCTWSTDLKTGSLGFNHSNGWHKSRKLSWYKSNWHQYHKHQIGNGRFHYMSISYEKYYLHTRSLATTISRGFQIKSWCKALID